MPTNSSLGEKVYDLFKESAIVQGVVTLVLVATWCKITIDGNTPPDALTNMILLVLGFWFGTKTQISVARADRLASEVKGVLP